MDRREGKDGSLWEIRHHKCEYREILQTQFLPCFTELKLNPDSSNSKLQLTQKNSVVTRMDKEQRKDVNPFVTQLRFTHIAQVMCAPLKRSKKDRYYWEVAWSGEEGVKIAVSYEGIQRSGLNDMCRFGRNPLSWSLECTMAGFCFWHNNAKKIIPVDYVSSRIGVFLDYEAGTLSFFDRPYVRCDTLELLYKVETDFTEDLCPGFWLGLGSTVGMCRKEREYAANDLHYTDY